MSRDSSGAFDERPDAGGPADAAAQHGPGLWDANARVWTRAVRERRIASRTAGTDAALLDTLRALGPRRLLDAGCGEGWLIRALRQVLPACRAIGIDGAPTLVAAARAADPVGCYHLLTYDALAGGDWRRDPLLAERLADPLDAVVFNYALFDREIAQTLRAARELLAPDGALVIQTLPPCAPGAEGWCTEDFAGFGDDRWVPMRWYARSRPAWDATLAEAGLRVDAEPASADAQPLSLLLVARPL
jgi:SAM-dependent methyltransferase